MIKLGEILPIRRVRIDLHDCIIWSMGNNYSREAYIRIRNEVGFRYLRVLNFLYNIVV